MIIKVADNGKGIPVEFQSHIFERFSQVNPYASGTGLDLSYSKILVELNEGNITLISNSDKGTSFIIAFPIFEMPLCVESNEQQTSEQVVIEKLPTEDFDNNALPANGDKTSSKPFLLIVDDDFRFLAI